MFQSNVYTDKNFLRLFLPNKVLDKKTRSAEPLGIYECLSQGPACITISNQNNFDLRKILAPPVVHET